ncbi:flagellar motor protein MotB [Dyadobacter luteus]|uniref:Flagellar motor protein MotB n=1 Tax=Dyadobacter luteus TaxID=2259619 RepID=A0A3D8YBR8_9BACT|nr:OmpA family protein [Dyadobacter luteus]REA61570.1 flagellar motor protein MotB [Dyadobacter luteus]
MIFIRLTLAFLFLISIQHQVFSQKTLWASKVLGYSSEYRPDQYGHAYRAKQILGEPNKLPALGDSPCAWTSADPDSRSEEWIKVGFSENIKLAQVAIGENFNPGAIVRVYVYDESGKEVLVYTGDAAPVNVQGRMLNIFPAQKGLSVNAVKIVLQPDKVRGFNQIDAIAISEKSELVQAMINLAPELPKDLVKENLGKNINSKGMEINPVISPDGKTLYFTRSHHPENVPPIEKQDVWSSTLTGRNQWSKAINVGAPINNNENNAIVSISSDGKTLYLINHYRPDGKVYFGLSQSFYTKNGWSFPKDVNMPGLYSDRNEMDLAVSPHGNVMILSLQRRDTQGYRDLYVSFKEKDDVWSEPKHMGEVINSADFEGTPFLALDNKTLYFSSNGHSGFGGNDIFMTTRLDDSWTNWSKPLNLGPVVNTPGWDGYFNVPASGDYAYFSSATNSLGSYDIFRLTLPEEIKPEPVAIITGSVLSSTTNEPVIADILADIKKDAQIFTSTTYNPENGEYRIVLPAKETYRITASAKGYFPVTEEIDLLTETGFRTIQKNLLLQPVQAGQQIRLNNTMFQQSSAEVVPSSFAELDRIVAAMTEYPAMEILLEGHTDNQGDVSKNVQLSEERVQEVKKYLLSKGIDSSRIQTKAWGPAKPIASNATEETRKRNRRVEFTVLKL